MVNYFSRWQTIPVVEFHRADQPVCPISSNFAPHAAPRCMRGFLHYAARPLELNDTSRRTVKRNSFRGPISRPDDVLMQQALDKPLPLAAGHFDSVIAING
jgi:hypothetical protein